MESRAWRPSGRGWAMFMSPFRRSGRYEKWGCWQA